MKKSLSLKRLYMLAVGYCKDKKQMKDTAKFLKYVSLHWQDEL